MKMRGEALQCSHSRRIARDSLGNCKNYAHFPVKKRSRTFFSLSKLIETYLFALTLYIVSIYSFYSESLIKIILFGF